MAKREIKVPDMSKNKNLGYVPTDREIQIVREENKPSNPKEGQDNKKD